MFLPNLNICLTKTRSIKKADIRLFWNSSLLSIDVPDSIVCLKDIHLDNVRIFGQGVQKFVKLNLYTAL